ncbi:class I SAM-dependent methyltransferase [Sinorhizobium meliloti]|uniref:class I SAM-dependent methyltransferase n=1 Tax=Rhizobium meliloti TaxID=382 RepID=UPI000FDBB6AE|nr:class I SAM-dependent methyltransferase [Sinorhizobium meliloti]RVK92338.1 class I SAM-dependent methyltransferase [Sinorhizobium meliloti]RVN44881.1 class I SAM-dependent methyltransferase [Sinorhizobium meliloti]
MEAAIVFNDFSHSAANYEYKPGYSAIVVDSLTRYVGANNVLGAVVDVGAGTGKLTRMLADRGARGIAIEPNEQMRAEGIKMSAGDSSFAWLPGTAEVTGQPTESAGWVCMAGVLQVTDAPQALSETRRILRENGFLTVMSRLEDLGNDPIHDEIEALISKRVPNLRRAPQEMRRFLTTLPSLLTSQGFGDSLYMEASQEEMVSAERFIASLRAAHDIPSQIGLERWETLIAEIGRILPTTETFPLRYRTHAWTVTKA